MPINSTSRAYNRWVDKWTRCRDTAAGSDAVKDKNTRYLPQLKGQSLQDYESYKMRALWYGATGRTIQGLRGAVFRKDPIVVYPESVSGTLETITDDNLDLTSFALEVMDESLTTGRQGLLTDMPPTGNGAPYVSRYGAENVINWRTKIMDGKEQLTMVVLRESVEIEEDNDEFITEEEQRYRVLRLDEGTYVQQLWDEKRQLDEVVPRRLGRTLDFIPFRFINWTTLTPAPEKPPLLDVVDVNLSHYRTSADLEHGAHFTALPTPWLAGFPVEQKFPIGSGVAFVTDNVQAKAGMLEFTGKGLDTLIQIKSDKERLMAVLGARLLEEQRKGVEAAETARLHRSGETGALSAGVRTASRGIEDVLRWVAWWQGAVPDPAESDLVSFQLNNDFVDTKLGPQEITALLGALQQGAISIKTWLYNLQRGEILPPEHDIEDEIDMIEVEAGAPEPTEASDADQVLQ